MIVLAIDPGASGAGYCVWDTALNRPTRIHSDLPLDLKAVHYTVIEHGFRGRMGKLHMWGLGFDAGWRAAEARGLAVHGLWRIRPDGKLGWRAALPAVPGTFQEYDGPPGEVIVKRLRARYAKLFPGLDWSTPTEHEVEAVGIAEAAAAILQRPKASARRALVEVKR